MTNTGFYENIRQAYQDSLIGKKFVYCSKYGGETIGEVADVSLHHVISHDKESARKFKIALSKASSKVQLSDKDLQPIDVKERWSGWNFKVVIHSTNGMRYDFHEDNIYIINKTTNE
jgi:hypothetical protein